MDNAQHGRDDNGQLHHGEVIAIIICPPNPSLALRKLAETQIAKREKRGEMTTQQAEEMKKFIGTE
jgi:hypothetical protein